MRRREEGRKEDGRRKEHLDTWSPGRAAVHRDENPVFREFGIVVATSSSLRCRRYVVVVVVATSLLRRRYVVATLAS